MLIWLPHLSLSRRLPEQIAAIQRLELYCDECKDVPLRLLPGLKYICVHCICDEWCRDEPARGKVIEEIFGGVLRNFDLNIRVTIE
jgi:hypothetical protein